MWIGLNALVTEGRFFWASGVRLSFSNWGAGEPNNSLGIEDNATSSRGSGLWYDLPDQLAAIFNDVWSFLYFLLNYGVYVGLISGAGASGTLLRLLATKKLGKRRETSEPVSRTKV